MVRYSRYFVILLMLGLSSAIRAQEHSIDDALNFIDSTRATIKLRSDRFNEEIAKINKLNVLDVPSLDSVSIKKNKVQLKDFIEFLDVSRSLSRQLMKAAEDSVARINELLPKKKAKNLTDFLNAFESDQKAFNKYMESLSKVFSNVEKTLSFLQTCDYTIKDKKILFTKKTESDKYGAYFKELEEAQKKAAYSGADSQRASIEAGDTFGKSYEALQQ
jgi:hypothetical protein